MSLNVVGRLRRWKRRLAIRRRERASARLLRKNPPRLPRSARRRAARALANEWTRRA